MLLKEVVPTYERRRDSPPETAEPLDKQRKVDVQTERHRLALLVDIDCRTLKPTISSSRRTFCMASSEAFQDIRSVEEVRSSRQGMTQKADIQS